MLSLLITDFIITFHMHFVKGGKRYFRIFLQKKRRLFAPTCRCRLWICGFLHHHKSIISQGTGACKEVNCAKGSISAICIKNSCLFLTICQLQSTCKCDILKAKKGGTVQCTSNQRPNRQIKARQINWEEKTRRCYAET